MDTIRVIWSAALDLSGRTHLFITQGYHLIIILLVLHFILKVSSPVDDSPRPVGRS